MRNRVESLDYLRGLMAAGIMTYHFFLWTGYKYDAGTILGRLGIYGVSVFYVLSGLTLFVVYNNKLNVKTIPQYFVKRIFRIFPLLWLCIALTIYFSPREYDLYTIFINVTGIYGFVAPSNYIAVASWSIGNELFFYSIFPLILLFCRKNNFLWILVIGGALFTTAYFAFFLLNDKVMLASQWKMYVHPLNQVILFASGIIIGKLLLGANIPKYAGIVVILISCTIFVLYPISGNSIHLVSGTNRLIFILLAVFVTGGFFVTEFKIGEIPSFILGKLGEISYSVYLLHPLVFNFIKKQLMVTDKLTLLSCSFVSTISISFLVYYFYEKKFIQIGQVIGNPKYNRLKTDGLLSSIKTQETIKH